MNKIRILLLPVLSGILFSVAWPCIGGLSFLLFVALVPLLFLEEKYYQTGESNNLAFFGYSYIGFFLWNLITTWWIYYSSFWGAAMAVVCNSLFMTIIFYLFHLTRKKVGSKQGYIALIVYWIAWEWWHMQWDLSWPWLTFGNGFANYYKWIQWYEYTGVFGGSLWILIVNILIFKLIKEIQLQVAGLVPIFYRDYRLPVVGIVFLIIFPIIFSLWIYNNYEEKENPINVVVVQPNIDPYNEKFDEPFQEQLKKMFELGVNQIDSATDYLVFPETALTENIWENDVDSFYSVFFIKEFLKNYPRLKIITGASTYYQFQENEKLSATARKFRQQEEYYDAFNTALQFDSTGKIQIYHKSKLVVGVEKMPYPALFKPLEDFAINLGGTSGSLGMQEERTCFTSPIPAPLNPPEPHTQAGGNVHGKIPPSGGGGTVAPVVCYESIYGEYVTDYIKNGADIIFIITNDGWWDNTPGHRQHLAYGRLRAIETRRSVARSANTGISCFMNQRGDIFQTTKWWEPAVIKQSINKNSAITFYVKHGDYIARAALLLSLLLLLWTIIKSYQKRWRDDPSGQH